MTLTCRDDLVSLYIEAMQSDSFSGVYNATAPNPVRMSELCSSLGSVLGRPSWLPVPDFALQVRASPCSGLCLCPEHALCAPPFAAHAMSWLCSRLQQDLKHCTHLGSRFYIWCLATPSPAASLAHACFGTGSVGRGCISGAGGAEGDPIQDTGCRLPLPV